MNKDKLLIRISFLTTYLLIFLFTYTGVSKLIDHENFLTSLLLSPLIKNQAFVIAWLVPVMELLIVAFLLSDKYREIGLMCSLVLMIIFTAYIVYMILFIKDLPCSCGGVIKELSWSNHILFNSFFILLISISILFAKKHKLFIAINRISRTPV
jgi:putative oxidoreductase